MNKCEINKMSIPTLPRATSSYETTNKECYCPVCDKPFSTFYAVKWVFSVQCVNFCSYTCYREYITKRNKNTNEKHRRRYVVAPSYINDFMKYMTNRYTPVARIAIILRIAPKGIGDLIKADYKSMSLVDLKNINDFIIKYKHHHEGFRPNIKKYYSKDGK